MNPAPDSEQQARRLVRDVGTELCRHLRVSSLHPDLVAELYLRVVEELRSTSEQDPSSSLALAVYMVIVSQHPGIRASTDLIPRLEGVIARTLSEAVPSGSPDGQDGQERRS